MADTVSRIYSNFRGVDFRGEEVNLSRSPDAVNMWKDYKKAESIRTRPNMSVVHNVFEDVPIYGIYFYKDKAIVHAGHTLWGVGVEREPYGRVSIQILPDAAERKSSAFIYDGIWYFKDGTNYVTWDGESDFVQPVQGYIPTTSIARKPMGGGKTHEDINMISDYRINTFLADGVSFSFYLDTVEIDADFVPVVKVNDVEIESTEFTIDYALGKITFTNTPPDAPLTDGQDNVWIKFKKEVPEYKNCIMNCTMLQVFDNRIFVSGNSEFPNYIWHSSLDDPTYFSDLDYYKEGLDNAAVTGFAPGNNGLWVFRQTNDSNTTMFYHTPSLDEDYGKIYPSAHSSISLGCVGGAINFKDDIVFFSSKGMEGISGDVTTEQVASHRSSLVDSKLCSEPNYNDLVVTEWEGYLFVFIGDKAYLADSRAVFQNEDHMEYEWYYWELGTQVVSAAVDNNYNTLHIGTSDGKVYQFARSGEEHLYSEQVTSYWTTPKDKFKYPNKLKTTNKRGCVVEALGDLSVSAKMEDTEFETVGEYEGVTDYIVPRIKKKKFKDLQLKFSSNTRFSLETVALECFIGGYIKR